MGPGFWIPQPIEGGGGETEPEKYIKWKQKTGHLAASPGLTWLAHMRGMKWSEVTQSCPTLSNPVDCSLPDSSIHGIFQARVLYHIEAQGG